LKRSSEISSPQVEFAMQADQLGMFSLVSRCGKQRARPREVILGIGQLPCGKMGFGCRGNGTGIACRRGDMGRERERVTGIAKCLT